jgi:UDP-2,3-diacylglucosamine pyrophosphatase LpxH
LSLETPRFASVMKAIIVSDLHIGSRYFFVRDFEKFLESIPGDYELILNGDVIDNPKKKLNIHGQRALDRIERISHERKVIWVVGNHDNGFISEDMGRIEVKPTYHINNMLLIAHGHDFDEIMPRNQAFMKAFKMLHDLRIFLGARPVHVANYAKKWKPLYKVLRKNVMKNAVVCAKENGFRAVTCGHTHFPEDIMFKGIRYINTGTWTEHPLYYLLVEDDIITLKRFQQTPEDHN